MNQPSLRAKLAQSEDPWVERKQSFHEDKICKTLVAFANSVPPGEEPGVLFIGASTDGKHPGVTNADELQKKVTTVAQDRAYPPITIQMSVLPVEVNGTSREILAVQIPASTHRPHFTGGAWVRRGSETRRANDEQFRELIASHNDTVRKLRNYVGKPVVLTLRSEPSRLYIDYYQSRLTRIDAHTIEIDTNEGPSHAFATSRIEVHEHLPGTMKIVAPSPWPELEHIERMAQRWAFAHAGTRGVPNDNTKYLADQLFTHVRLTLDGIRRQYALSPSPAMTDLKATAEMFAQRIHLNR